MIAAAISDKSPWAASLGGAGGGAGRDDVSVARAAAAEANSDHVTLYKVYHGSVRQTPSE